MRRKDSYPTSSMPNDTDFVEKLEQITGRPPAYVCEISSVTALHVGEGAVAVSITG